MACLLLSINCVWPFHILNLKNFQLKKTDVHLHFPRQRAKYNVVVLLLERPDTMWLIWGTVGMLIFYFQMVTHKTFLDLWSLKFLDFDLDDKFLDFIVEKLGVGGFPLQTGDLICCEHILAATKWSSICRRHFQMNFLEWKYLDFERNLAAVFLG